MNKLTSYKRIQMGISGLFLAGFLMPTTASAISFSNPGSAVSSGDKPFALSCKFDDYNAVGTYSIPIKMDTLPQNHKFSFSGSTVKNGDGSLSGYVYNNNETRREWRMETGMPGSPIYRFTHFKQSDVVVANIDILGETTSVGVDHGIRQHSAKTAAAVTKTKNTIGLLAPLKHNPTTDQKTAYANTQASLKGTLKVQEKAAADALAAAEADRTAAGIVVPDIHSIKGNCRWQG